MSWARSTRRRPPRCRRLVAIARPASKVPASATRCWPNAYDGSLSSPTGRVARSPSVAGFLGYASVVDPAALRGDQLTLYSATPIGFLPGVLEVGHDHGSDGWFPGGTLVPTGATDRLPSAHCHHPSV